MKWLEVLKIYPTVLFLFGIFLKPPSPWFNNSLQNCLLIYKFLTRQAFCVHLHRYWSHETISDTTLKQFTIFSRKE